MRITVTEAVDGDGTLALWPVYDAVFGDQPSYDGWRSTVWDRHVVRGGFRLAPAYDGERLLSTLTAVLPQERWLLMTTADHRRPRRPRPAALCAYGLVGYRAWRHRRAGDHGPDEAGSLHLM